MVDKLLDEDDIIDLTDLLEEGDSKKKGKGKKDDGTVSSLTSEPDSFDLGKEISMEYDVSVEEIDHAGESLDMDVSLSSNEEVALKQAAQAEVDLILEPEEKALPEEAALTPDEEEVLAREMKEEELPLEIMEPEEPAAALVEETATAREAGVPAPVVPPAGKSGKRKPAAAEPIELTDAEDAMPPEEPLPAAATGEITAGITEEALVQLKQDLPAMLEGVVKPLMAELVREIISATREQLPGIVEKVIREEIDKLKKLD